MKIPQIRLTSTMAQIDIKRIKGSQEIEQPKADISIEQPKAEMTMETKPAKLLIDQTKAWEDMNLYGPLKSTEKRAQEGHEKVSEGTVRRAEEGTEMMRIENQGQPIINQAVSRSERRDFQLGIKFIPSHFSVKTTYVDGELNIQVNPRAPIINITKRDPIHIYKPDIIETHLKNHAELEVDFVNLYSEKA